MMQLIDKTYFADSANQETVENALTKAFAKTRLEIRLWVGKSYAERLEKLYAIVDYWTDYFRLTADQTEELMRLATLIVKREQHIPSSYDLNLYPIGIVRVKSVPERDVLALAMINWVAGNAIVLEGSYSNELISGLSLIQPFEGAIQFVNSMEKMKITFDAILDESWNQKDNPLEWVNQVSLMLHQEEWDARATVVASGY